MRQILPGSAKTTHATRAAIQRRRLQAQSAPSHHGTKQLVDWPYVFIVDASGSWTREINNWALHGSSRQARRRSTGAEAAEATMPQVMEWLGAYTPAPSLSLIGEDFVAQRAGAWPNP